MSQISQVVYFQTGITCRNQSESKLHFETLLKVQNLSDSEKLDSKCESQSLILSDEKKNTTEHKHSSLMKRQNNETDRFWAPKEPSIFQPPFIVDMKSFQFMIIYIKKFNQLPNC